MFLAGPPRATAAPGDLDPTFVPAHLLVSSLHAAAIAPSGRVLVGGSLSATNALGEPITSIALLGPDGALDPSFGVPGIATRVTAITAAEDGTVVCAGLETNGLNAVVRRLTATGALDATLDHVVNGTISPWIYTLARQADGRVLVGGVFQRVDGIPRTNLFRIHVDGTLDESFKTNFTCGGGILALAQQPDGKILLGGYFTNVLGVARRGIARLNLDGSVDTTFNPGSGIQGMVKSIALQADGRVLLGGHFYSFNGVLRAGIARLHSNGTLDTSFNPGAGAELAARDESIEGPAIHAVVIQGDGRIVVGGEFATFDRVTRPNLARLEWNGALDETFDPGAGTDGVVHSLNLDATGQLVVVGDFLSVDRQSRVGVARLLNDGTLPVLPTVLTPPADQTVTLGKPATFSVSAKGTPALRYQWLKSGLIIAGQTNDTFTLSNCQFADAGSYSVQVANGAGTVTSSAATLIVNPAPVAPVITTDPAGAIVVLGGSVSLSAAATGSKPMAWQWRLGSVPVSGATSESLTLSSVSRDDAGSYTARASNAAGTATSAAANVSVIMPPEDQTVRSGSNVTFTVRSFGTGTFTYQWRFEGAPVTGGTKPTLTVTNVSLAAVGAYSVIVSNGSLSITSPPALLAVHMAPRIDTQPADLSAAEASTTALTVGVSGSTPITYQWRMQGTNLPGQTADSLSFAPLSSQHAGYYSVVVANAYGSVTSRIAAVTVLGATVAQLRAADGQGFAGGVLDVPISLSAAGNENTASFSIAFDPALLTLDSVTNGAAIGAEATVLLNENETATGRLGVLVAAPAGFTFPAGSNHLLTLRFTLASSLGSVTSTSVGFTNSPVPMGLLSASVQPLALTWRSGAISIEGGWEADLNPDPDGDGLLTLEDLGMIAQLVAGLATPADVSQFVRADCAPLPTRGDGFIAAADWTQAARYVAGLDSPVRSGGPQGAPATAALHSLSPADTSTETEPEASSARPRSLGLHSIPATTRRLELVSSRVTALGPVTVSVRLRATGNENTAGFSLSFDPAKLRLLATRRGANLGAGASVVVNDLHAAEGRLGVLLGESAGIRLRAGTHELLAVEFEVLENAASQITFADSPVLRELVSSEVNILPTEFAATTLEPVTLPVAPQPRPLVRQRTGALLMRWDATRPGHYVLETSTDLQAWTPITEWDVLAAATLEFTDPDPARGSHRFYRVR